MRVTTSRMVLGPIAQLAPTTSAPFSSSTLTASCMEAPARMLFSSAKVNCPTIGISRSTSRAASRAIAISPRWEMVSKMIPSTPASTRADTCSPNASWACCGVIPLSCTIGRPRGPTDPRTKIGFPPAATRACSTASRLISPIRFSRPNFSSLKRLAPNVLVSMTSAPASIYCLWVSTIRRGSVMLSSSKQRLTKTPLWYSMVPMAPSQSSTRSSRAFRKARLSSDMGRIPLTKFQQERVYLFLPANGGARAVAREDHCIVGQAH
ncbi:hypothetical protein ES703_92281 [subsurface metagenome]